MDSLGLAALLGLLEGLTEFIPVSSTGHLLLAGHFLGFDSPGNTFEVVIQLGAVLALISVYAVKLGGVALAARTDPAALRALVSILVAFFPAVVVGLLAHDIIKTVLFESPRLIATMLILGGIILLVVDRAAPRPVHTDALALPLRTALIIGLCQCLAMVPGVSRSGATIVGAMMLRVDKRAAAEFSFLLSLPTMAAAPSAPWCSPPCWGPRSGACSGCSRSCCWACSARPSAGGSTATAPCGAAWATPWPGCWAARRWPG
jgi:undecaprenyl-diphosphatase